MKKYRNCVCVWIFLVVSTSFASHRQSMSDSSLFTGAGTSRESVVRADGALVGEGEAARDFAIVDFARDEHKKRFVDIQVQTMCESCCLAEDFPTTCASCGRSIAAAEYAISSDEFCEIPPKECKYFHFIMCVLPRLLLPYKTELSKLVEERDWPQIDLSLVLYWLHERRAIIDQFQVGDVVDEVFEVSGPRLERKLRRRVAELERGLKVFCK